jgi:hypothetical protein
LSIFALRVGNKTMLCHPCAGDWITSSQIPSRIREARQIAAIIAKLPELPLARANNKTALHSVSDAQKKKGDPALAPGPLRVVASIPSRMKADEF